MLRIRANTKSYPKIAASHAMQCSPVPLMHQHGWYCMHKHKHTARELLEQVLPDMKVADRELLFFVLQNDYHVRMGDPAVANLSTIEKAIHDLFGVPRMKLLRKLEGSVTEA
jgi:hypothetical protein